VWLPRWRRPPVDTRRISRIAAVHDRSWSEGELQIAAHSPDDQAVGAATRVHAVRFYESRESLVDAAEMLSRFMDDGMRDAMRFRDAMIPVIEQACRGRKECVIRASGEMVDVLCQAGQTAAAIRLEMLWNQLAQTHSFALLCGSSVGPFYEDVGRHDILRQHTHLVSDSGERATLH
jgi:hypothetical protein